MPTLSGILKNQVGAEPWVGRIVLRPCGGIAASADGATVPADLTLATDDTGLFSVWLPAGDYYLIAGSWSRKITVTTPETGDDVALADLL